MKNITKQYQDLLEGKMSKDVFMRNARREFPQWVSPVNSFNDAVNILKSKRILSETSVGNFRGRIGGESRRDEASEDYEKISRGIESGVNPAGEDPNQMQNVMQADWQEGLEKALEGIQAYLMPSVYGKAITKLHNKPQEVLALTKGIKDPAEAAKVLVASVTNPDDEYDPGPGEDEKFERDDDFPMSDYNDGEFWESLNEDVNLGYDRVDYRQLMRGTEFEMSKMQVLSDDNLAKAKEKAYKKLCKNPNAYRHLVVANYDAVEKIDKGLRDQEVKKDIEVDKANAMKVIKKDDKANTQTNLGNKERAKGMPKGVKTMKESVAQRLKENILEEYFEIGEPKKKFVKGEKVVTPEGQVGVIEEMTPDYTAEIKLESGEVIHKQGNVLKPHVEKHVDEYEKGDEQPDDSSFQRWSSEKRGDELGKQQEVNGFKARTVDRETGDTIPGDMVKVSDEAARNLKLSVGKDYEIVGFSPVKPGKILSSTDVLLLDPSTNKKVTVNIQYIKKAPPRTSTDTLKNMPGLGMNKFKSLKEKLVKSLKKEIMYKNPKTKQTYVTSDSKGEQAIKSTIPGVQKVPGSETVSGS